MTKKCLVISANNNIITFKATLLAVKKYHSINQETISSIIVIRTIDGEDPSNIAHYKAECETVFPEYDNYNEKRIETANQYLSKLPVIFRELLSQWDPGDIIVDLTNGTKSYTDFVYLACTLLDIRTIFRVSINREYYNNPNDSTDYLNLNMESVLSQSQIRSFVNKTYAEYIYYYNEVKELTDWFQSLLGEKLSRYFFEQMLNSFEKYATGEYCDSIINLSTMTEELLKHILDKLKDCFDTKTWEWMNSTGEFALNNRKTNSGNKVISLGSLSRDLGNILTRANKIITNTIDVSTQAYDKAIKVRKPSSYSTVDLDNAILPI